MKVGPILTGYVAQSGHLEILQNFYFTQFISNVLGISYKIKRNKQCHQTSIYIYELTFTRILICSH